MQLAIGFFEQQGAVGNLSNDPTLPNSWLRLANRDLPGGFITSVARMQPRCRETKDYDDGESKNHEARQQ